MFGQEDNTASADAQQQNSTLTDVVNKDNSTTQQNLNPLPPNNRASNSTSTEELLNIKQQALTQLQPLVQHLDLSPEEKFRTTMMMIQASDNPSMIKSAYEIAQKLSNDQQKAQALLDIVNEINYFTHLANNQQD